MAKGSNTVFQEEETRLVGVDGSWVVLFKTLGALGFVICRRHPSGRYEVSWIRIVPMVVITVILCVHLLTYSHSYTDVTYDLFTDIPCYAINALRVVSAFALAVFRRREMCLLLQGLEGTLEPPRTWVSILGSVLFLLSVAFFLWINNGMTGDNKANLFYWICMTVLLPVLPSLLDILLTAFVHALANVYKRKVEQLRGGVSGWTSGLQKVVPTMTVSGKALPSIFQSSSGNGVSEIVRECKEMSALVSLFNKIFSPYLVLTSFTYLVNMMNASYYIAISFFGRVGVYVGVCYGITLSGLFYLLCRQADSLNEAYSDLEDTILDLQQRSETSPIDRIRLQTLSTQLHRRPVNITLGNVGVLGSHILVLLVNIAITYTAILFQYRPVPS